MDIEMAAGDMSTAGASVAGASADARGADGADALAALAAALPGSSTAAYTGQLGGLWRDGVSGWCDSLDGFEGAIRATSQETTATDGAAGGVLDGIRSIFGGS